MTRSMVVLALMDADGSDTIDGGTGSDVIDGGDGADVAFFSGHQTRLRGRWVNGYGCPALYG